MSLRRLVRNDYELQDAAREQDIDIEDAARDLALISIMASLHTEYSGRIVFKGGSVLRYAWGANRTSGDTDATVIEPAKSPLEAEGVRRAIDNARAGQFLHVKSPDVPATNNKYSLDFDGVEFVCADVAGTVNVELSYREQVVLEPLNKNIGPPYFQEFVVSTMRPAEMACEKLRALVQRTRGTDLADFVLLERLILDDDEFISDMPRVREQKFKLVQRSIKLEDVVDKIDSMKATYEAEVQAVDPDAPSYDDARDAAIRVARMAWR